MLLNILHCPGPSFTRDGPAPEVSGAKAKKETLLYASLLSALCVFVESSQKKSEIGAGFFSSKWFLIVKSQATEKIVPNPDSAVF